MKRDDENWCGMSSHLRGANGLHADIRAEWVTIAQGIETKSKDMNQMVFCICLVLIICLI